ncbi:MAG: acetyltransferase, partial [Bryobacteraceae bacterium]
KDKGVALTLDPSEIAPTDEEPFEPQPFTTRTDGDNGLNLKVLVNFAPQNAQASTLQETDTGALVSLLRCMQRDPRIGKFSVVAFNAQEQKVLYRQDGAAQIDFPAIGEAVRTLRLGRVDIARLANKNSETEFLADLLVQEIGAPDKPDAFVIIGPKTLVDESIPAEKLKTSQGPDFPVFYLNYNLTPTATPWRDAIGAAVRFFKGQEYTISKPRDLWFAITELVGKVVKSKSEKRGAARAALRQGS